MHARDDGRVGEAEYNGLGSPAPTATVATSVERVVPPVTDVDGCYASNAAVAAAIGLAIHAAQHPAKIQPAASQQGITFSGHGLSKAYQVVGSDSSTSCEHSQRRGPSPASGERALRDVPTSIHTTFVIRSRLEQCFTWGF